MSLQRGAARGTAWNLITVLGERSFGFGVLVILLRHVSVRDVGTVALASAISELARMVTAGGAGEQVVAAPGDRVVEAGAFWAQLLLAALVTCLLFAAAAPIAAYYRAPALGWVTRALSLNILLGAFLIVPAARLSQAFRFRALSLMSVGSTMLGGAVALALVFRGYGLAALVVQRMVGIAFYALASSIAAGWRPPAPPRWTALAAALRFNLPMMGAAFVDYLAHTGYVVLVGMRVPVVAVGEFRIAQRLAEVLQELAILPASKVFLPIFVAVREEPARRFAVALALMDSLAILSLGAAAVSGAVAGPLVTLMFGARWASAAPVFAALSLIVPASTIYAFVKPMLTALRRPGLVSAFAAMNAGTIVLAAWIAAPFGLVPLGWALSARGLVVALLMLPALSIGIGKPAWPLLRLMVAPVAALIAARLGTAALMAELPLAFGFAPGLRLQLVIGGGAAGVMFVAVMLALAPRRMTGMARRLAASFRRAPAVPVAG
ncbi:MAG TPA: oligosaccharide flippase family protein [Acidiphilium sp.]|nr:oligosaccharide flippase family protein [Acidiphilium sp.]